jgi:hypothetical protein
MPKILDLHINCYTSQHVTSVHILHELPKTIRKCEGSYLSLCLNFLRNFTFIYPWKTSSSDNLKWWLDTVQNKAGVSRVNIHSAHSGTLGNCAQLQQNSITIKSQAIYVSLFFFFFFCNIQVIYSNPNMRRTLNAKTRPAIQCPTKAGMRQDSFLQSTLYIRYALWG